MTQVDYKSLLNQALNEKGQVSECYSLLYSYSLLNAWWLAIQLRARKQSVVPCASFGYWNKAGGKIKKGAEALYVTIPLQRVVKESVKNEKGEVTEESVKHIYGFKPVKGAFSFHDVEGIKREDLPKKLGRFNFDKALKELDIELADYDCVDGNTQGYAITDSNVIAINPLAENKIKTFMHEVAHMLLHKGDSSTARNIKEVEAEASAYLVLATLGKTDCLVYSRGYIQSWLGKNELPEASIRRIFATASKILKAGLEK